MGVNIELYGELRNLKVLHTTQMFSADCYLTLLTAPDLSS